MSNRDPIAKCLRRVDWHVTLLSDVSTLCALDVILRAAPVEKNTCLVPHSACSKWLVNQWSYNCKKTTWKNILPTPRFFDDTRVKLTYFTVAFVLPISTTGRQANWLAHRQALNDHYFSQCDGWQSIKRYLVQQTNTADFMPPMPAIFFLFTRATLC